MPLVAAAAALVILAGCDTSKTAALQRMSEGVEYVNSGDHLEAVRRFEESIALNPADPDAHYLLGMVRLQHYHAPGEAVTSLEQAIELDPEHFDARYQLGVALAELGREDDASRIFEQVVELEPEHAGALFRMGQRHEALGEIRDAIDDYTRSIYADRYFPLSYNALGNIYSRYGRLAEARQVFENGIDNCISDAPEYRVGDALNRADVGRVYLEQGDTDLAITYLEQAAALDPVSSAISMNLGIAYRQRFEDQQSEDDRRAALENLTRARARCNPVEEEARCNSIAAALRDLRTEDQAE